MRLHRMFASLLGLLMVPAAARCQTEEVQHEIETQLWVLRVLAKLESATGAPPLVVVLTLIALMVALVVVVWLWKASRKSTAE